MFAEDEASLLLAQSSDAAVLETSIRRRIDGEPLEQILGWALFRGLRIAVEPGVFVPRRRTEFVVDRALSFRPQVVLDLCCGSGAIAAGIEDAAPGTQMHAADVDPAAVRCARRNVRGTVYEGDLYEPLPSGLAGTIEVIVANAPYVPSDSVDLMPREARLYEARVALDGGADGLELHRRILAGASHWLAPGGHVLIETSRGQADADVSAAAAAGLDATVERSDEYDATVLVARRDQPKRPCT